MAPAAEDDRSVGRVFRVGFVPQGGDQELRLRTGELVAALTQLLGEETERHEAADYHGLVAALERGVVDLGWVPPLVAAPAALGGGIVPIAVAVRNGGASYSTALIVGAASPIATVADLHGARAAWVDRESAGGYAVIRAALRARGVSLTRAFGEEIFLRSHARVAAAVRSGLVDAGACYFRYHPGTQEIARAGWTDEAAGTEDIRILAEAGPIPSDFFAVHRSVPPARVAALEAAFVDARPALLHRLARELLHADGFVRASQDHGAMLRNLLAVSQAAEPRSPLSRP